MPRIILGVIGFVVIVTIAWSVAQNAYFTPRSEYLADIEKRDGVLTGFSNEQDRYVGVLEQIQKYADRTLGDNRETVEAALRERLNRIAEEVGLVNPLVTTSTPKLIESPALRKMNRRNTYRKSPDFVEIDGAISGGGQLETMLRLIHRIEAEPWLKRINSYTLDPGKSGRNFSTTIRLTTMYIPGTDPGPDAVMKPHNATPFARYASFVNAEPFRVPPAPVQQQPAVTTQPPPPLPGYNYGEWAITMVTESSKGLEVWLHNRSTGESRTLVVGDSLEEIKIVSASSDEVEFSSGPSRFLIEVGKTLADRSPIQK